MDLNYESEKKIVFSNSFLDRYFDSLIQKKISFSNWVLHTLVFDKVMIHIEFLFTSISNQYSLILKMFHFQKLPTMGSHGTHASAPSSSNYKTVKTTLSLQIVSILYQIGLFLLLYMSLLLALNDKSRLFKNVQY